jgi:hypothetical protein
MELAKGKTKATPKLSKLAPTQTPPAPCTPHFTPAPTEALVATVVHPPLTSACEVVALHTAPLTLCRMEEGSLFLQPQPSGSCGSQHLNTIEKCNIWRGIMDTICDKM